MVSVLLALEDVGLAVRLQESLESAGHSVTWDTTRAAGPEPGGAQPDAVILAPGQAQPLRDRVEAWRDLMPPPAVIVVAEDDGARREASAARAQAVEGSASPSELAGVVADATKLRYAARLSPAFAMAALRLAPDDRGTGDAIRIVAAARHADVELVREALRWHAYDYVAATELIEVLRHHRALEIPEVDLILKLDGARTVQTVVREGGMQPVAAARLLWALVSIGAILLSPEPPLSGSAQSRAVAEARRHLRARRARLASATLYDVLEVGPKSTPDEVEQSRRMLAVRYAPDRLRSLDLGDVSSLVDPVWKQIEAAYAALLAPLNRKRYDHILESRISSLEITAWAHPRDAETAERAFERGQRALLDGDVFRAVSEMAMAARTRPDHPDYEASLAWARYRAEVTRGKPRKEAAARERKAAEEALLGRRAWPRGLVALGLLCAADSDPDSARWHLREALTCDPNLPAARQMLSRLSP